MLSLETGIIAVVIGFIVTAWRIYVSKSKQLNDLEVKNETDKIVDDMRLVDVRSFHIDRLLTPNVQKVEPSGDNATDSGKNSRKKGM